MRLVKIVVQRFQGIESAELELGPGLNVLYGPNDLGKSTLAEALRAVLLLQHSSAAHEAYVSWYGDDAPRVELTLQDDDDRYWRVAKTFGTGSTGQSKLFSSKDGKTFVSEGAARSVDEKLRGVLRWGLRTVGGKGGGHGMPTTFLSQVLVPRQDDVRKIFSASLEKDDDESGRLHLAEVLGALAQDPLFKEILEAAQGEVDKAFTPTGRKKSGANTPFAINAAKLKELHQEKEALSLKVEETDSVMAKIHGLQQRCEDARQGLVDARQRRAVIEMHVAAGRERNALLAEISEHRRLADIAETLRSQALQTKVEAEALEGLLVASEDLLEGAKQAQTAAEQPVLMTRRAYDELASIQLDEQPSMQALLGQEQAAKVRCQDAQRDLKQAEELLRRAEDAAVRVVTAQNDQRQANEGAGAAEEAAKAAVLKAQSAKVALETAQARLHDITGGDQQRSLALAQAGLENRRLQAVAVHKDLQHALGAALLGEKQSKNVQALREDQTRRALCAVEERAALGRLRDANEKLGVELIELDQLVRYAAWREKDRGLTTARRDRERAGEERELARSYRRKAASLRGPLRMGLPSTEEISELRKLQEELKIAEARLSAVTVTVRPRRPISVQLSRDGEPEQTLSLEESISWTASRDLSLGIDALVQIEVAGGDANARGAVLEVRERWKKGEAVLAAQGVSTVEQLAELRSRTDRDLRDAADLEREAQHADDRAAHFEPGQLEELERGCEAAAVTLEGADLERLAGRLEALGTQWSQLLKEQAEAAETARSDNRRTLESKAVQLAGEEAQLEVNARELARAEELAAAEAPEGSSWATLIASHQAQIARVDVELEKLTQEQALLHASSTTGQEEALAAVQRRQQELQDVEEAKERAVEQARQGRDALVVATTRLEAAVAHARELDAEGSWASALLGASEPLSTESWRASLVNAKLLCEERELALGTLQQQLAQERARHSKAREVSRLALRDAEDRFRHTREEIERIDEAQRQHRIALSITRRREAEQAVQLAKAEQAVNLNDLAAKRARLEQLGAPIEALEDRDLEAQTRVVDQLAGQLGDLTEELTKTRGSLEHVGGAVVREKLDELRQAIEIHEANERAQEIELDAWQLLRETLHEEETKEGQHLGRQLAVPVGQRFHQLTKGRYGALELDPHLKTEDIQIGGEPRDVSSLSAGTQDQLATLIRICIAEYLRSTILLDDQLSQCDPSKVAWFNEALRESAPRLQVLFITCRPGELLADSELPGPDTHEWISADGLTKAIDLSKVIRRVPLPSVLASPGPA